MSDGLPTPAVITEKDYERLWEEYKLACDLAKHQHNRWRDVMGIYLTANAVLGAGIATIVSRPTPSESYTPLSLAVLLGLCVLGCLVSFLWFTSMLRIRLDIDLKNYIARWLEWRLWKTVSESASYWASNRYVRIQEDFILPGWGKQRKDLWLEFPSGVFSRWLRKRGPNLMEKYVPTMFFLSYVLFTFRLLFEFKAVQKILVILCRLIC